MKGVRRGGGGGNVSNFPTGSFMSLIDKAFLSSSKLITEDFQRSFDYPSKRKFRLQSFLFFFLPGKLKKKNPFSPFFLPFLQMKFFHSSGKRKKNSEKPMHVYRYFFHPIKEDEKEGGGKSRDISR